MMSPEQIAQLSRVETNYEHIMEALKGLQGRVEQLPTHKDLAIYATAKEVEALRQQVDDLKRGSPSNIGQLVVKIAAGLLAVFGAYNALKVFLH